MPRFLNNVDLLGNQLQNAVIQPLGVDPGSPKVGQIWFHNTAGADTQGRIKVKLGTRTLTLDDQYVTGVVAGGTPNGIVIGGTALAPTVSMALASGAQIGALAIADYNLIHTATNLATNSALVQRDGTGGAAFTAISIANAPVAGTDGVNKAYADSIAAGFDPKASVVLATNAPLPACTYSNGTAGVGATLTETANGALTTTLIDGTGVYTLQVGDRILVKNQATAFQNGIYTVTTLGTAGTQFVLTRTTDFNSASAGPGQISTGAFCFVEQGTYAVTQWILSTTGAVTVGTTGLSFSQFGAASAYTNGNGLSLGGNVFSVNLTGTNTLEFNSTALRLKSSATANQVLLSGGTGVEPAYGALPLGNASAVSGTLGKANGGFGQDVSTGVVANTFAAAPNGASGAVSFRAIVPADLPTTGTVGAGTYTKVTVDAYGRISASAALAATDIPALDFAKITTGIVPTTQGGTGLSLANISSLPVPHRMAVIAMASGNTNIAAPGANIDGVAMSAGQRILLTGQTTTSQNGLWIWNGAAAALTRPADYAAASASMAYQYIQVDVLPGGTANGGTTWYLSTSGAVTIDTTGTAWAVMPTNIASGAVGLLPLANGGTNASTAAGARTNLGAAGVYNNTITGDGTTTNFVVTHGLNSSNVTAKITDPTANNEEVFPNIQYTSVNTYTVIFSVAPTNGVVYGVRAVG
jgi:hypothetical protein